MITVIASTSSNPSSSGSQDHIIDLSIGDTLPQDIPLYAYAQDSADPTATLTYSWYLLRAPVGSNAALSASNVQQPTLESVDTWGDYRLFCIASNTATGETSEADPIKAPNEAFTQVRIRSTNLALVKPAPGERDWFSFAYEWVNALESLDPLIDNHETRITTLEGASATTTFSALTDTTFTGLVDGQVAVYQAGAWVNQTLSTTVDPLSISGPTPGSIDLATQSLAIEGTSGEVEVAGLSSGTGYSFTIGLPSTITSNTSGSAGSLTTARTISLSGDVTGSASFDGSADITIAATLASPASFNIAADNNASGLPLVSGGTLDITGGSNITTEVTSGLTATVNLNDSITVTQVTTESVQSASLNADLIGAWRLDRTGSSPSEILTRADVPGTGSAQRAGVLLSSDYFLGANTNGAIPNMQLVPFSQQGEHTYTVTSPTQNNYTVVDEVTDAVSGASITSNICTVMFFNHTFKPLYIYSISSMVLNAGQPAGTPYSFELIEYKSLSDLLANIATVTGVTLTHTQTLDNGVSAAELIASDVGSPLRVIPAGGYFGMTCRTTNKVAGFRYIANILGAVEL
jgi:hypothetical protein